MSQSQSRAEHDSGPPEANTQEQCTTPEDKPICTTVSLWLHHTERKFFWLTLGQAPAISCVQVLGVFLKPFYSVSFWLRCWVTSWYTPAAFQWHRTILQEREPKYADEASLRLFRILRPFFVAEFLNDSNDKDKAKRCLKFLFIWRIINRRASLLGLKQIVRDITPKFFSSLLFN